MLSSLLRKVTPSRKWPNILQVTEASVYGRQKLYREGGLASLSTKIVSGRRPLLSDAQFLAGRNSTRHPAAA